MEDTNKHIAIVVRYPVGGIRTYLKYIYQSSIFNRYKFTLIAPQNKELEFFLNDVFKDKKFRFIGCEDSTKDIYLTLRKSLKYLDVDLIHSHGFSSGMATELSILGANIPHILTSHDVLQDNQFPGFVGLVKKSLIGYFFGRIQSIVCVGEDAKANLLEFYPKLVSKNNVTAIRNGIDSAKFLDHTKRDLKAELKLNDNTYLLGFFGRFMSQKGFRYLVEAISILSKQQPNLDIQVVSFGWGGFIREEQEALKQQNLDHLFHFLPHTDEMPAAIRGVDLAVLPSLWEACPLLPMEIMVTGTPLITSDCIGMAEVIKNTPVLSFKARDANSLAATLKQVMESYVSYQRDIRVFSQEAANRFDAQLTAGAVNKHYIEVLSKNHN